MTFLRKKRKKRVIRSPRFLRIFTRNTSASISRGNRVMLFSQGGDFLPAMLQAVMAAERRVDLEFYLIRDDCTGCGFSEALLAAAARGVAVRLIYDYIGCFDTPGSFFKRLEKGGVRCLPFNPPPFRFGWFDKRNHRKMAIVDGRTAFVGGVNIGDEYAGFGESTSHWRDMGVRIDGPAAAELQTLYNSCWRDEGGKDPGEGFAPEIPPEEFAEGAEVMIVSGGPHHNRSRIRSAFRMALAGAAEDIKILTPYFLPGPRLVRSLLRAAGRDVRVRLVLPEKSDVPIVRVLSRSYYALLLRAGIEIYERQGTVLHAKVMLIDDYWAVIGSANLDQRSFHRNHEINVIVDSNEFGEQVAELFLDELPMCRRIELAEHERRGYLVRLLERCCSILSWFL